MSWRSVVFALSLYAGACWAQSAQQLLEQVRKLRDAGRIDQAQPMIDDALAAALSAGDRLAEGQARHARGQWLNRKNRYAEAKSELDRAFAIFESLGERKGMGSVYRDYAFLEWAAGNRGAELDYCRKALAEFKAAGSADGQAITLVQMVPLVSGVEEKLKLAGEAYVLASEAGDRATEGRALLRWGDALFSEGKFEEAAGKLNAAVTLFVDNRLERDAGVALVSLGRVYRAHGMHQQSLDAYRRALEYHRRVNDPVLIVQALNAISVAYGRIPDPALELDYARQAIEEARKTGTARLVRRQLLELGTIYRLRGDHRNAVKIYEEAIAAGGDADEIPWRHLAVAYSILKDPKALETADRAVETNRRRLQEFLPESLRVRAVILAGEKRYEDALKDLQEGLDIIERQRRGAIATDAMKRGFSDQNQAIFAVAVDVLAAMGRHGEALETAESARGRAFVDLMATRAVPVKPQHAVQLAAVKELEREMHAGPAGESLPITSRGTGRAASPAALRWRAIDPELRSFVSAEPYKFRQFTETAARLNSTILSYWVNREATHVWVVGADGSVHGVRVDVRREEIQQRIAEAKALGASTRKRGETEPEILLRGGEPMRLGAGLQKDAWKQLYRWLIRPVSKHLPEKAGSLLTIVPHGPLHQLPFAALMDEQNRYLVERYRIHTTPAGAVLEFTAAKKRPDGEARLLLVADPSGMKTPEGRPLPPLPGARREVRSIAQRARGAEVTVLSGLEANESRVRAAAAGKTVVHFATHGVLRPDQPWETFLALAPPAAGSDHDAWLTAGEVYGLDLDADLVVLSACRSAAGKESSDGLIGLTRAFFYAGAPSVLASVWDAADEPASQLAADFYRGYFNGLGKSGALRQAQMRMISALRAGKVQSATAAGPVVLPEHPLFWAGFILAGEP